jgi:hypothetical protein
LTVVCCSESTRTLSSSMSQPKTRASSMFGTRPNPQHRRSHGSVHRRRPSVSVTDCTR